jgi:cobyrinic acid a,c-diamide synthase
MKTIKGIVVAGPHSGSGKTTIALGLMAAWRRRGLRVAPFKIGPDFIDPGHHGRICGRDSRNLDGWMLSRDYNLRCFAEQTRDADIAVVEGVMGLFDGYDGRSEAGSTAQMAKWLRLPVLLVVDARSMARSAAALVQGFENFDPDLTFAGVLFNQLGSRRHFAYLREAVDGHLRMPCLGGIEKQSEIAVPERHLGLTTHIDHRFSEEMVNRLADLVESGVDLDRLSASSSAAVVPPGSRPPAPAAGSRARIGVAWDNAFCFYYPDNFDLLRSAGAELIYFSPLRDADLPAGVDGLYLGGGYPELYADRLSQNTTMQRQIRQASRDGMPVYAECGGLMFLGRALWDLDGKRFPMTGCLPVETRMLPRLKSLGYRQVELAADTLLGPAGLTVRGHEFHYSEIRRIDTPVDRAYRVSRGNAAESHREGFCNHNTLGSYMHLHFGSRPECARYFVENCSAYHRERKPHA